MRIKVLVASLLLSVSTVLGNTANVITMTPEPTPTVTTCSMSVYSPTSKAPTWVLTDAQGVLACVAGIWQVKYSLTGGGGGGGPVAFVDVTGAATDAQIPDTITVDFANAAMTAPSLDVNEQGQLIFGGGTRDMPVFGQPPPPIVYAKQAQELFWDEAAKNLYITGQLRTRGAGEAGTCTVGDVLQGVVCGRNFSDMFVSGGTPSGLTVTAEGTLSMAGDYVGGTYSGAVTVAPGQMTLQTGNGANMVITSPVAIVMSSPEVNIDSANLVVNSSDASSGHVRGRVSATEPTDCTFENETYLNSTTDDTWVNTSVTTLCSWTRISGGGAAVGAQYQIQAAGASAALADSGMKVNAGGDTFTGLRQVELPNNAAVSTYKGNLLAFPGNTSLDTDLDCTGIPGRWGMLDNDDLANQNVVLCQNGVLAWDPPAATDDSIVMGDGTKWVAAVVPGACDATTGKLVYTAGAPGAWTCGADAGAGVAGDSVQANAVAAVDANFIDSSKIAWTLNGAPAPDTLSATIVANSLGVADIGTDGVDSDEIKADAVGTSEIATDGVGAAEIGADQVGASEIAAGAVGDSEWGTFTSAQLATHTSDEAFTGSDVELGSIAGLTSAADKLPYFTGSGTAALADLSSGMRTFMTTSSSANLRSVLTDENGTGPAMFAVVNTFYVNRNGVTIGSQDDFISNLTNLDLADGGFTALRNGSITGISVNMSVTTAGTGVVLFGVTLDAGTTSLFDCSMTISGTGFTQCQNTQAMGVDTFSAGQTINVLMDNAGTNIVSGGTATWTGVATGLQVVVEVMY